jgi:hypothetical protein
MKKASTMLLQANFDIDQIGETLEWRFSRKDGDGNPITGRYAGGIYFTVGEKMYIHIQAINKNRFKGFEVLDCCLITRPQIYVTGPEVRTIFAPPSPFIGNDRVQVNGASIDVPARQFVRQADADAEASYFGELTRQDGAGVDPDGFFTVEQVWDNHLEAGKFTGRWEISFVITVKITLEDGKSHKRVFSFDPEGEVGNGINPPV